MPKLSAQAVRSSMDKLDNIRNVCIIGPANGGKSQIFNNLVDRAGIEIKQVDRHRYSLCSCSDEEQNKRQFTALKSDYQQLYYQNKFTQSNYLLNLINTPGNLDCISEVIADLRVSDGAIVVVEAAEGAFFPTQKLLQYALQERVRPLLVVNKIDRLIIDLEFDSQKIYQTFSQTIDKINACIQIYKSEEMGIIQCDPIVGNVAFTSGKGKWGFTLKKFARLYSAKFAISEQKMVSKLWGDNYFDQTAKKWRVKDRDQSGKPLKRCFTQFIMEPIRKLCLAIINGNSQMYLKMLKILQIQISKDQEGITGKALLSTVMNKWLSVSDCLLEAVVINLHSPIQAQRYRISHLYDGPDFIAEAMRKCDPKGPLMLYVSKMIPSKKLDCFYAFARVFSGNISSGDKVAILGNKFMPGSKHDYFVKCVTRIVIANHNIFESIPDAPCGNIILLIGIDKFLVKTGTVMSADIPFQQSFPIRNMIQPNIPLIKIAVAPSNPQDLPKVLLGLQSLEKSDSSLSCGSEETGQNLIIGCSQSQINASIIDLQNHYSKCLIQKSNFTLTYRETISSKSSGRVMVKSQNKHNRLYGQSLPLAQAQLDYLENDNFHFYLDNNSKSKKFVQQFGWEKQYGSRIWSFGPDFAGSNILTDSTKGLDINELKNPMITSFQWATKLGVLCEEPMRGIQFNILDCQIFTDAIHRGGGQIIPAARRLYYGLQLISSPTLFQPFNICHIISPTDHLGILYATLSERRAELLEEVAMLSASHSVITYLPVNQSIGFAEELQKKSEGKISLQCMFDHWQLIKGLPYHDEKARQLILKMRQSKGLKIQLPNSKEYIDYLIED